MLDSGWQSIEPFHEDGYSYTGAFRTDSEMKSNDLHSLDHAIRSLFGKKPSNLRTRAGDELVELRPGDEEGAMKFRFQLVMGGGAPLTYGECAEAIQNIVTFLESDHGKQYDRDDLSITISKNGQVKIIVTTKLLAAERLEVIGHGALDFDAWWYPEAPFRTSDMQGLITIAIKDFEGHVQRDPPPTEGLKLERSWGKGNAKLVFATTYIHSSEEFPQLTYATMVDVLQRLNEACVQTNAWAAMVGEVALKATALEPRDSNIAYLGFEHIQLSALPPTNDTSVMEEAEVTKVETY